MSRVSPHAVSAAAGLALALTLLGASSFARADESGWRFFGGDSSNNHRAEQTGIHRYNVDALELRWVYRTTDFEDGEENTLAGTFNGDVTATPAVSNGVLYFPDWAGYLHAVDTQGNPVWKVFLQAPPYSDPPGEGEFIAFSRNTPAVSHDGSTLVLGSKKQLSLPTCPIGAPACIPNTGAVVIAIDTADGQPRWRVNVDPHPAAQVTGSPVIHRGRIGGELKEIVILGVSSWEEEFAISSSAAQDGSGGADEPYPCCSFRGSVVALDLEDGSLIWQTPMSPGDQVDEGILEDGEVGFVGVAVYSGSPAIDRVRNQVYVGTGNNYVVPEKAKQCERHRLDPENEPAPELPPGYDCRNLNEKVGNHVDAMVALDLDTGAVNWVHRAREYDAWVHACAFPDFYLPFFPPLLGAATAELTQANIAANCPDLPGPDFGFGQAPMLIDLPWRPWGRTQLVGAGEKSGRFFALDPDDGELVWETRVSPGGVLGGMQWGSATDGRRIYTASSNSNNASRNRFAPFYPNPMQPLFPGYPTPPDQEPCVPGGAPCEFSGPGFPGGAPAWRVRNPPADVVPDGVSTWIEGFGPWRRMRTITGMWSALDARTGVILWQRPLHTEGRMPIDEFVEEDGMPGTLHGSVTLAKRPGPIPGVVFGGGTFDGRGTMLALDARTGRELWRFNAQFQGNAAGGIESSPAVVEDCVYWGAGASRGGVYSTSFLSAVSGIEGLSLGGAELRGNKMYAFCLPED